MRFILLLTTPLLLFALASSALLWAQKSLTVRITPDSEVYRVGQPVTVSYTVVNDGAAIFIKRPNCTPTFGLIAYDTEGVQIWNSEECVSCCCTCCQCPILIIHREIPTGRSHFPDDTTWRQVRITGQELCGCITESVRPGTYYLVGQVLDSFSEPVQITVR